MSHPLIWILLLSIGCIRFPSIARHAFSACSTEALSKSSISFFPFISVTMVTVFVLALSFGTHVILISLLQYSLCNMNNLIIRYLLHFSGNHLAFIAIITSSVWRLFRSSTPLLIPFLGTVSGQIYGSKNVSQVIPHNILPFAPRYCNALLQSTKKEDRTILL